MNSKESKFSFLSGQWWKGLGVPYLLALKVVIFYFIFWFYLSQKVGGSFVCVLTILNSDFSDGIILIRLLETLTGQPVGRFVLSFPISFSFLFFPFPFSFECSS